MKFITPLTQAEKITLKELLKNGSGDKIRMRAHAILLSHKKFKIDKISHIYEVHRNTVSIWFERWETQGIVGLFDVFRSGRPPLLSNEEQKKVLKYLEEEPRNIKRAASKIAKETGKSPSLDTIKRLAKSAGLVWKRVRKSLKKKRDNDAFEQAKAELSALKREQQEGKIGLLFFDESGFTLEPVVPYAWQPIGETIVIPSAKSRRLNVLGFMDYEGQLEPFVFEGAISTNEVIACFNLVAENLSKPTHVVLDNASIHKSALFKEQIAGWEKKGLFVKYIPAYSPELNLIEILWKHIKYFWLPFSAYENFNTLKKCLDDVLRNVGKKYKITFA